MDDKGQIFDAEKEKVPAEAFPILKQEQALLQGMPEEQRLEVLINLRFKAWLSYNKLKPDALTKIKMKQAFFAGFMSRSVRGDS